MSCLAAESMKLEQNLTFVLSLEVWAGKQIQTYTHSWVKCKKSIPETSIKYQFEFVMKKIIFNNWMDKLPKS